VSAAAEGFCAGLGTVAIIRYHIARRDLADLKAQLELLKKEVERRVDLQVRICTRKDLSRNPRERRP
jgi:hypothetical protein